MAATERTRRPWPLVAMVLVLVVAAGGCTGGDEAAGPSGTGIELGGPPPEGVLRFGMVGLDHLDPAFVLPSDQSGMVAADLLFDGLTAWDPESGTVVPALASAWSADATLTEWTFTLGEARFSDGSPVTAADVTFSLSRLVRLGNLSLVGVRLEVVAGHREVAEGLVEDLAGVVAIDERTVRITTVEPYAPLPVLLSSPLYGIVPRQAVLADAAGFDVEPVTSGPYRLEGREGPTVRLTAVEGTAVPAPSVELVAYPDAPGAYAGFQAGELDWSVVPAGQLDEATERYGGTAVVPFSAHLVFAFNLRHPTFVDMRFRTAVAKAIDRQALLDAALEAAVPLDGVVPAGVPGFAGDGCGERCAHDPAGARALLAELHPDGRVPEVELDVYDDPVERDIAERVAEDLRAVGIPVTVVAKPFEEYQAFVVSGGEQLYTFGWVGAATDADLYVAPQFLSGSTDNITGFDDPWVDLSIRAARAEADPARRTAMYAEIDRLISTQVPVVPVATYVTATVVGERVEGYAPRPDGTFDVGRLRLAKGR